MKLRAVISFILIFSILSVCGCSDGDKDLADPDIVMESANFSFTEDMVLYMVSYTKMMLADEMKAAKVDDSKPLSEQMHSDGKSWKDYLYEKTVENIEYMMIFCEAAHMDEYAAEEGMIYKANESVSYLSSTASDLGIPEEEYIEQLYGENVTMKGLETCTQMLALCEGYEIHLQDSANVADGDAASYAEENPNDFLKFDALRFTTADKAFAEKLAASETKEDFLSAISKVSGLDLTDSDKNGVADMIEVNDAVLSSDIAGDAAMEDGRAVGDTVIADNGDTYTVTMFLSLPERSTEPVWDFRMIYISSESSTDPYSDAVSLRDQWIEKNGGESGFSNIAARYSDAPSAYYGGRVSTTKSDMPSEEIFAWLRSNDRKAGDSAAFPGGDDGAYIIYYINGNIPMWEYEAEQMIRADYAMDHVSEMEDEIRKSFELNEELLRELIK